MKTSAKRIMLSSALVCSILTLGFDVSAQSVSPLTVTGTASSQIDMIRTSAPARTWSFFANQNIFDIKDGVNAPFQIDAGAPSQSLRIGNTGRILFSISVSTTPQRSLHVIDTDMPALRLQQSTSGGNPAQTYDLEGSELGFRIIDVTNANNIPFSILPGAPTDSLNVTSNGNVGIGTSAPAGKLHVNGAGAQLSIFQSFDNNAVQFRLQTNGTNRRFVALNSAGTVQSQLLFGDNGAFDFLGPTASDVRMRFLANGNVGIGTTAPTQLLSVNGTAGKPGGGSWATFSDERLKNIKGEFKGGLDEVLKLKPIRYEYKADNAIGLQSEGEHIGFGAEAVRKIIPEAVTENSDGYLMVDNDPILWTMLNAIKEQNAQIADLRDQNRAMKTQVGEIARLEEQLERLQAQVVLQGANRGHPGKPAATEASR